MKPRDNVTRESTARLLSVNVGMPRDIEWRGRTVHTGIWKDPVQGRRRVAQLNVEGDGQGDPHGHGGKQRAVFVYQIESFRYWERRLRRSGFAFGQFGENFTVEGLPDDEVCIGDRYRIGTALFEVTQPRATCYRVGIRLEEPRMAALLTSSGRPGFYFRVLEEGEVGAGDPIELVERGPQQMTVTEVSALLYSPPHPREGLERAVRIPALSAGWRRSFEALIRSQDTQPGATGNAGLAPDPAAQIAAPGFRPLRISRIERECADVISLSLQSTDGRPLALAVAGQFVVLRVCTKPGGPPFFRSYSLSGPLSHEVYRVSVKVEPNGVVGTYLSDSVRTGDILDVSEPRGNFTLRDGDGPVVLLSAGIGATPVLAMLHALAEIATPREVWWLHGARNGKSHYFADEARKLLSRLTRGNGQIWYSRPTVDDREGRDYDASGRLGIAALENLGVPREADFYLCGPSGFLADLQSGLADWGVPSRRTHFELFAGVPSRTPGVIGVSPQAPHQPSGALGTGPLVSFARSGITVRWRADEQSLLELAEACDVPVRWACRTGVCHTCERGLISGVATYDPVPLDAPAEGNVLICCARPGSDLVIDL